MLISPGGFGDFHIFLRESRIQRCARFNFGHTYWRQSTEAFENFHTDFFVEVDCGPRGPCAVSGCRMKR